MLSSPFSVRAAAMSFVAALAWGTHVEAAPMSCFNHKAVAGDTLIGLSETLLTRPADWPVLARLNHVRDPRRIPVGTVLCIPIHLLKSTPRPGVVLEVVGQASRSQPNSARQEGPVTAISKGDVVSAGMTLRTSADGYVTVQLADGSILKVQANTEARLDASQHYEAAGFFSSIWSVLRGRVESLVTHLTGGEPRYQIKTPQAVLGVRGTEFRVQTDEHRTLGETLTGAVFVRSQRQSALVSAGQGTVSDGQQVSAPTPLPPAPDLSQLPSLHERPVVRLSLPASPGARAYRVQVAEDADFRRVRAEATDTTPTLRLLDLPDGQYHLRARVIDAQGLESADALQRFTLKARPEPPLPTAPAAKAKVRDTGLSLSWAAHPEATGYRLQIAQDATFQKLVAERLDLKDSQTRVDLPPGDYVWRLATTRTGSDHGPWGDAQAVVLRPLPAQAQPPRVTDDTLYFELPAEPGQRFELQVATDAAFARIAQSIPSDTPSVAVARPAEGGHLHVRYRAIDTDGFIGPYSRPQVVVLPACVRDGTGHCLGGGARFLISPP